MLALMTAIGLWILTRAGLDVRWVIWVVLFGLPTIFFGYRAFDRAVKVRVDQTGIDDFSAPAQSQHIPWSDITEINLVPLISPKWWLRRGGLSVTLSDNSKRTIEVSSLDMDPDAIARETKAIWREAIGGLQGQLEPPAAASRPRE
jgi:hypothetical protein